MKQYIIIVFLFSPFFCFAQAPAIEWEKCYGGSGSDAGGTSIQKINGGYIFATGTTSNDGNVTGTHTSGDYWIVRTDDTGHILWQKSYGGSTGEEQASFVDTTNDKGFLVTGYAYSNDGDVAGNHGGKDIWVVKLDDTGHLEWQKCLGGSGLEFTGTWIGWINTKQLPDSSYIIATNTDSHDGDVVGLHDSADAWIVKLSSNGSLLWQKCLGGRYADGASSIIPTQDGGYIVCGSTESNDGDVSGNHGATDVWIVKLNKDGNVVWQKCYGGSSNDWGESIVPTADGGYIVASNTQSPDGDVKGFHGGTRDGWIFKINATGTMLWQKCFGGTSVDFAFSIKGVKSSGYIMSGFTASNDGDVSGNHGSGVHDYWVVRMDDTGKILWQKCLGGSNNDLSYSILQTDDGGYIVSGYTLSHDSEVTGYHGGFADTWVVKLGKDSVPNAVTNVQVQNVLIYPNPTHDLITIEHATDESYTISNIMGRSCVHGNIKSEKQQVDISTIPTGVYLLELTNKEGVRNNIKILKE